jgi:hypothetical protein
MKNPREILQKPFTKVLMNDLSMSHNNNTTDAKRDKILENIHNKNKKEIDDFMN